MESSVQVLRRECADAAVHVLTDALVDDPGFVHVLPDPRVRRESVAGLYGALVLDALQVGTVLGLGDDAGLAGVLVLYPPGGYPMSVRRKLGTLGSMWRPLLRSPLQTRRLERFAASIDAAFPTEPTFYVAALGVRSDAQRRGYGRSLVEHTLRVADRAGAPCYLETGAPRNVPYYETFGFDLLSPMAPLHRGGPPEARMQRLCPVP